MPIPSPSGCAITGIGILPEHLPHIHEPFYQLDPPIEKAKGGLGIGLTLVWQLVEMHGGTVTVHSDGPDRGSEFVVRLPRAEVADQEASAVKNARGSDGEHARRILIVDDNHDSADAAALILQLDGHDVKTVYNGYDALSRCRRIQTSCCAAGYRDAATQRLRSRATDFERTLG